jgi:copper(I)-binding protein
MRPRGQWRHRSRGHAAATLALGAGLLIAGTAGAFAQGGEGPGSSAPAMAPMESMAPMASMDAMPSMAAGLVVLDAWTRESPMMELAGAAYMVLENTTTVDDTLVRATSPAATVVELHRTAEGEDGTMAMMPVEEVPIPAGDRAVLEPGGYHIMLIGLVAPLVEGEAIEITLDFAQAAPQTISVPVRALGPMGSMGSPAPMGGAMDGDG